MSEPIFNFHDTLLFATAIQSLLFVFLIAFAKQDRHISDYYLIGFFLAQALIPVHILVNYGEEFRQIALNYSPLLFHSFDIVFWLEGPLLLWYTRSLLYTDFKLNKVDLLYLLPAIGFISYIAATFYFVDNNARLEALNTSYINNRPTTQNIVDSVQSIVRVFFSILALIDITRAQKQIRERYSNIDKIDLNWLGLIVIAFTVVRVWVLLVSLLSIVTPTLSDYLFNIMGLFGNYMTFGLISTLMFYSLQRSSLFDGHTGVERPAKAAEIKIDEQLTQRIEQYMQSEKPYLNHLLNLEQLASGLAMHPRALSVTIKSHFETNFYEFINSYRISEAKIMLEDPSQKNKTMIEILGLCGFNSKATYNTFFKKLEGCTPSQYRKKHLTEITDQ